MIQTQEPPERRILVVGDLHRLGPILAECFSPQRIDGVHTYLDAIAEIPIRPTRAVLVGHDAACRKPEAAIEAMKAVASEIPVIFCCEPAYEQVGQRLLDHGADDYIIFPPESADLEKALGIPSRKTRRRWTQAPVIAPAPSVEELARLAEVLPKIASGAPGVLDSMAALVCTALDAHSATIVLDDHTGRATQSNPGDTSGSPIDVAKTVEAMTYTQPPPLSVERTSPPAIASQSETIEFDGVLIEQICIGDARVGQIRVGPSRRGGYTYEDTAKLRHYSVLFARMFESGRRFSECQRLSQTDDLTGLPNRRRLLDFLEETLTQAQETRTAVTAMVFDIDDFKRYNDTYGHDAGDEILRDVGKLFVTCSRKTDMVARYGGDEFVVIFWDPDGPRVVGSHHPEAVVHVLERFRAALRSHHFGRLGPEAVGRLTISGGLAHYPWQARTSEELLKAADEALLSAKRAGKNRFWVVGGDNV